MIGISGTVPLSGNRGRLRPDAAASIARVDKALGRPLDINSAWRDPVAQAKLRKAYIDYVNGRGPWAPIALEPWESVHCDGGAVDTDDGQPVGSKTDRLLVEHGWILTVYRNGNLVEPWHREYKRALDKHYGEPASTVEKPKPQPKPPKEDDMSLMAIEYPKSKTTSFYVYDLNDAEKISKTEAAALQKAAGGGRVTRVSKDEALLILDGVRRRRTRLYAAISNKTAAEVNGSLDELIDQIKNEQ